MKFFKNRMSDDVGATPVEIGLKVLADTTGATAIEYGLIAALIAVAAIAAMQGLGSSLTATFNNTSSTMAAAS